MDGFIRLTTTDGIEGGGLKSASLDDHELLVANAEGAYFIADARCPHMGGFLPDGTLEGTVLTCPRHHSQFDLRDGRVLRWTDWHGAKLTIGELLRHPRPLRTYEVKIEGADVYVGPENKPPTPEQPA
jgi:3-phenylpropionate/trans-cinnamate dioxygenase ferredoxin component